MDTTFENVAPFSVINGAGNHKSKIKALSLSIIIPIHNEKDNIPILAKELHNSLNGLTENYEIIFIDDGSNDGSDHELVRLAYQYPKIKIIQFQKNYGQTAALSAGFKYAGGDIIITMDGDLQNDPSDIPMLLETMNQGYDLVNGWRRDRKDKLLFRKIPSIIANRLINKLIEGTEVRLNDFGCTLKAYKKGIIKNIHLYGEMHRFVPVFAAWLGAKITEVPVNHRPRKYGESKYNMSRISRVFFDLIVVRFFSDYLTRPIQFFGKITIYLFNFSLLIVLGLWGLHYFSFLSVSLNTVVILIGIMLFTTLQILSIGLLGEILIRSYFETQRKDVYTIRHIIEDKRHLPNSKTNSLWKQSVAPAANLTTSDPFRNS